jgi:arsenate reductase
MAEGWARHLKKDVFEAYSAGIEKHGLNQLAAKVMTEAGVDIHHQVSKTVEELPVQTFDVVITLCGHAHETCPVFPAGIRKVHVGFDDPPALAQSATNEAEALISYRRVRDEIRDFIKRLPGAVVPGGSSSSKSEEEK